MTRNYLILFIIIWVFIAILLISLVGEAGFLAQNSKKELLKEKILTLNANKAELQLLENQQFDESQLDRAFKLGYIQKGDVVYFFEKSSKEEVDKVNSIEIIVFKGWNKYLLAFIALGITILLFTLKIFISYLVHKNDDEIGQDELKITKE